MFSNKHEKSHKFQAHVACFPATALPLGLSMSRGSAKEELACSAPVHARRTSHLAIAAPLGAEPNVALRRQPAATAEARVAPASKLLFESKHLLLPCIPIYLVERAWDTSVASDLISTACGAKLS